MAFSVSEVLLALRGDATGALRAIRETEASMGHLSETGKSTSASLAKIGAAAAVALGVTFVAAAGKSIEMASNFQKQMTLLQTEAGYTAADMKNLSAQVLALAPQVGKGPDELAMGLYHIASAGIPAAHAMDLLTASAKLSAIGNAGMEETTQAVIGVMAAYPAYLGHATDAVAMLNAIVGTGDMRMKQLTAAMATGLLPAAATAHIGLIDVGAALATLTDNVTPADEAATRLRMTLALLTHQSGPATDALATIGIKAGQLGTDMVKPDGLNVAISDLRNHLMQTFGPDSVGQTNKYLDILRKDGPDAADKYAKSVHGAAEVISISFGGGRTSAAIQTLLGEYDKFNGKYAQLRKNQSDFDHSWETTKTTFSFQINAMKAGVDSLAVKFGTALLPLASQFIDWFVHNVMPKLQTFADWFIVHGVPAIKSFGNLLDTTVRPILQRFGDAIGFVKNHFDLFGPALAAVVVTMGAFKVAAMIDGIITGLSIAIAKLTGSYVADAVATDTAAASLGALELLMTELVGIADGLAVSLGLITDALGLYAPAALAAAGATDALAASEGAATAAGAGMGAKVAAGAGAGVVGAGVVGAGAAGAVAAGAEGAAGGGILAGIAAAGGGALAAIGGVLTSPAVIIAGISFAVIEMYQHWDEFKTYISGSFMTAMRAVGGWFKEFGTYLGSSFMDAVHAVGGWFSDFGSYISGSFMGAMDAVGGWFRDFGTYIGTSFMSAMGAIGTFVQAIPGALMDAFHIAFTWLAHEAKQIPYQIGYVLGLTFGLVMKFGSALAAWASVEPGKWIWRLIHWTETIPVALSYVFTDALGRFARWGADMVGRAWKTGGDVLGTIGNWFRQLPGTIWQGLVDAYTHMLAWGQQAKDWAWNSGKAIVGAIGQWFHDLPGTIWAFLTRIVGDIGIWGGQMASGGSTAGSNFVTAVWNWVKDLPDKFFKLGGAVVQGFADGIEHLAYVGFGAIGGFLSGILDGANKALGIKSPSRVFAEQVGKPIAQGIALGIADNGYAVQGALSRILTVVPGGAAAGGTPSGGIASGAIGQIVVNNPASNVDVVTAIAQQQWLDRMSRRGIGAPASWPLTLAGA